MKKEGGDGLLRPTVVADEYVHWRQSGERAWTNRWIDVGCVGAKEMNMCVNSEVVDCARCCGRLP